MKLVSYDIAGEQAARAGVLQGEQVLDAARLVAWAEPKSAAAWPTTMLGLLRLEAAGMATLRAAVAAAVAAPAEALAAVPDLAHPLGSVTLRTPVPDPPTLRDFYAFEQHVKAARARRNAGMIPEWYQIAVFYFSNTSELLGTDEPLVYPRASRELDFELEMAAVIGRTGRDIPADEAPGYIAGYMVMNDWSARDLQRAEVVMNLGPAKGKDFATSLGPWLVTPDELADRRIGSGKDERYDLAMSGSINGDALTHANAKEVYFTFPQMIERASQHVRLRPGDIIGSGTCGTGCILELGTERHRWLQPGDDVRMSIEGLGELRTRIIAGERGG
jgi:fumarylacetoacetate (FAA) hydrolase